MNATDHNSQPLVDQLRQDLLKARKKRDRIISETLQSVVAAIDNAGAVPINEKIDTIGVGSTEARRRELSFQEVQDIIRHEIEEMHHAITTLGNHNDDLVTELRTKTTILNEYLN